MWGLLFVLVAGVARGSPDDLSRDYTAPPTPAELAADLVGTDRADRRFAARELARQARVARAQADRPWRDRLRAAEALAAYQDLRADAGVAARTALLSHPDVRAACASILANLRVSGAREALVAALDQESRPRVRKKLEQAIAAAGAP